MHDFIKDCLPSGFSNIQYSPTDSITWLCVADFKAVPVYVAPVLTPSY